MNSQAAFGSWFQMVSKILNVDATLLNHFFEDY